jgi:tripartite-type tricarboxylate transporter receptor subunit TctC
MDMIIPFPAGGGVDVIGRAVAKAMSVDLGQNIVIANRDGAAGTVGFNALASAAPDGYTLGAGPTTPIANAPFLVKGVRYQVESFDYICQYFENIFVLVVKQQSRFKLAKELITTAAANPGKLTTRVGFRSPTGRQPATGLNSDIVLAASFLQHLVRARRSC